MSQAIISKDGWRRFSKSMPVFRVMMFLYSRLQEGNQVVVEVGEIAKNIEVTRAYVSDAIRRLKRAGAITKANKVGATWTYQMSPNLMWKGSEEDHQKALDLYDRKKAAKITGVVKGGGQ